MNDTDFDKAREVLRQVNRIRDNIAGGYEGEKSAVEVVAAALRERTSLEKKMLTALKHAQEMLWRTHWRTDEQAMLEIADAIYQAEGR